MNFIKRNTLLFFGFLLLSNTFIFAQSTKKPVRKVNEKMIPTGVPVLLIAPDSRAGGLGDAGAATTPDANSTHWNNAKYAFIEKDFGFSLSYSPWMRNMTTDMNIAYLSGYKKIDKNSALALSFTYFDLGSVQFYDMEGTEQGDFSPYEMAVDATYSMKLSDKLSAGVSGRFILSDLTSGRDVAGSATHAGTAVAADIGLYWNDEIGLKKTGRDEYAIGLAITNLGSKISYSDDFDKDFLPTNLRLGGRYTLNMDKYNLLSFILDANKLLVPTPDAEGNMSDAGIIKAAIESFSDAPGGFSEEMKEISLSAGMEYWYDKKFAVRAGYFFEAESKGDRQYITLGAGLRYNYFGLDLSYLISTSSQNNSLKNTLRFTLLIDVDSGKKRR